MRSKLGQCRQCKCQRKVILHKRFLRNGAEAYQWVCEVCGTFSPLGGDPFISKFLVEQHLTADELETLPVIMPQADTRCVKCGKRGAEVHHWAPRALFGESCEEWPKDYLCKQCHDIWHETVTPNQCQKS